MAHSPLVGLDTEAMTVATPHWPFTAVGVLPLELEELLDELLLLDEPLLDELLLDELLLPDELLLDELPLLDEEPELLDPDDVDGVPELPPPHAISAKHNNSIACSGLSDRNTGCSGD